MSESTRKVLAQQTCSSTHSTCMYVFTVCSVKHVTTFTWKQRVPDCRLCEGGKEECHFTMATLIPTPSSRQDHGHCSTLFPGKQCQINSNQSGRHMLCSVTNKTEYTKPLPHRNASHPTLPPTLNHNTSLSQPHSNKSSLVTEKGECEMVSTEPTNNCVVCTQI